MSEAPLSKAPKTHPRPLSPHLQIYRPQITSVLSILHRMTGIALHAGLLLIAFWLFALVAQPESYQWLQDFFSSIFGRLILLGWCYCLFYHLCNGIRHLVWDMGYGFSLNEVYDSGGMVIVGTVLLTNLAWVLGYTFRLGGYENLF